MHIGTWGSKSKLRDGKQMMKYGGNPDVWTRESRGCSCNCAVHFALIHYHHLMNASKICPFSHLAVEKEKDRIFKCFPLMLKSSGVHRWVPRWEPDPTGEKIRWKLLQTISRFVNFHLESTGKHVSILLRSAPAVPTSNNLVVSLPVVSSWRNPVGHLINKHYLYLFLFTQLACS